MKEIWVEVNECLYPVGGFNQTYSVSNFGRVKNNKTDRILKNRINNKGYFRVNLAGKEFKVHQLVALHFVKNSNPKNFNMVNHIDGDKGNNHYYNLEWTNNSNNQKHAYKLGLHSHIGEKNTNSKLTEKDVLFIWKSKLDYKAVMQKYNLSKEYSNRLVNKRVWKHLIHKLEN